MSLFRERVHDQEIIEVVAYREENLPPIDTHINQEPNLFLEYITNSTKTQILCSIILGKTRIGMNTAHKSFQKYSKPGFK